MATINQNTLAQEVAASEGGKRQDNIGQVKDVTKCLLDNLGEKWQAGNASAVVALIEKHMPKNRKK